MQPQPGQHRPQLPHGMRNTPNMRDLLYFMRPRPIDPDDPRIMLLNPTGYEEMGTGLRNLPLDIVQAILDQANAVRNSPGHGPDLTDAELQHFKKLAHRHSIEIEQREIQERMDAYIREIREWARRAGIDPWFTENFINSLPARFDPARAVERLLAEAEAAGAIWPPEEPPHPLFWEEEDRVEEDNFLDDNNIEISIYLWIEDDNTRGWYQQ